jgi:Uma2 family endonuclease
VSTGREWARPAQAESEEGKNMALQESEFLFSPEEYLSFEREAEERHEYWDGRLYEMAGESPEHSTICVNLAGEVSTELKGKPCRAFSPNMKVRTSPTGKFLYPDLTVVCGEPVYHDGRRDVLVNPKAVFEVLSPSSEGRDRGRKFFAYQQIESLTDYLLVAQNEVRIDHYLRQPGGGWLMSSAMGLTARLRLESINCALALIEVYDRVEFPPAESLDEGLED